MNAKLVFAFALSMAGAVFAADIDLNGTWEFRFDEGKAIEETAGEAFKATDLMSVPGCYDMMPQWLCKRGTGLYRRRFVLDGAVENAALVVDGMGLRGRFSIDGKDLGTHPYPYARLELETGPLAAGEHVVFAALDNRFDWDTMHLARPYFDFYCFGGFYHGVSLSFETRKLRVRTRDYKTGEIEIESVKFAKDDFDATIVFDGKTKVPVHFAGGRAKVRVPDFKLWSPESPNLHVVEVDGVKARFGIREVKAEKRRILLNGKPIYLKGANRHEAHPTFGAATPESLMVLDLQLLKSLGGNFIRGCHYQQSQRFLDYCDEMGVMVWEESLGWGTGRNREYGTYELTNETFVAEQIFETREMVRASFNHPSVIMFGFMNEFASDTELGKSVSDKLVATIRAEDSGRLVTYASCMGGDIAHASTDVASFNTYPGWIGTNAGDPEHLRKIIAEGVARNVNRYRAQYPDKPIFISEMGTCGVYGEHDPAGAQWTEEFQAEYMDCVADAVLSNPHVCGYAVWQLTDARSYHRGGAEIRCKPFALNLAGLYDGYRRPKLAAKTIREKFEAHNRAERSCRERGLLAR